MTQQKKIYFIWIGWIGVSALARYYAQEGYQIFWSDSTNSELIWKLQAEWHDIIIWSDAARIDNSFEKLIYSGAVTQQQEELKKAIDIWLTHLKYNQALWEVVNTHKLIAIAGTHWKSTTTSMISQILKNSSEDFKAIIGTLLKEFDGKNFYWRWEKSFFAIEACEYKNHFLEYRPTLAVIMNIEYDHADFFKTPESYLKSYENFIQNIVSGGFCILNGQDTQSKKLIWLRDDINYIIVYQDSFNILAIWSLEEEKILFPEITIHIPGEHILFDAKISYVVWHMLWISDNIILDTLEDYNGVWRRMEKIWYTENKNLLISDYWHHPTEILLTLDALKQWSPNKKLYIVFQPHQYNRTLELLKDFKNCFHKADTVIIPNIYESRDSEDDKAAINSEKLASYIKHQNVYDGKWLENTLKLINTYDAENIDSSVILLLWAGDIDNLRYKIKTS